MNNQDYIGLAEECGLVLSGMDDENVPMFIGEDEDWNRFDAELEKLRDF
jgi:hypothetical protein